ncbi:Ornithine carbamoyltransferase, partial [Giardia duodenalis]
PNVIRLIISSVDIANVREASLTSADCDVLLLSESILKSECDVGIGSASSCTGINSAALKHPSTGGARNSRLRWPTADGIPVICWNKPGQYQPTAGTGIGVPDHLEPSACVMSQDYPGPGYSPECSGTCRALRGGITPEAYQHIIDVAGFTKKMIKYHNENLDVYVRAW